MEPNNPRRATRTGAIAAVLEQMETPTGPGPTPLDDEPKASQVPPPEASAHRQFYPAKGHARVPTSVCRPWRFADRAEWEFEHVAELSESFKDIGQVQPVLVRPIAPVADSPVRYEIIAGRARWEAAKAAGHQLDVVIRPLNDREAFRAMIDENEQRCGLSDYSRARRFKTALAEGVYESLTALADSLKVQKGQISKLLRFADLDPAVVSAFSSPRVLSVNLGYTLAMAIDAGYREQIIRDAGLIEAGDIQVGAIPGVWAASMTDPLRLPAGVGEGASMERTSKTPRPTLRHVADDKGGRLFTVRLSEQRGAVVKLAKDVIVTDNLLQDLRRVIAKHARSGKRDPSPKREG